ncbi:MAG: tRNA (adenosine(37)-N6)-threonylcarbamoyltransferase complex dimerization subunit type 1 TsaB [Ruminococcaceae bacterium]|nr:tRNA (adenosine(37)-N6)-threonylcarbamoyltransferase complex dimerization subunit type 1 TsaB [Oscillospiraceae bacterium]
MKILALDSTADVCTVALCEDKRLISEITVNTGNTHSQTLLPAVEQVLRMAELSCDDVDLFACSTGPGSFTGVRIGVATIKGLAYGKNKPCVSVSTLEALAHNLSGYNGIICPVMNARRNQVYNALFESKDGIISRLCPDRAISIEELDNELNDNTLPVYLCGDGYDITVKASKKTRYQYVFERSRHQSAYSVALCAIEKYERGETLGDKELVPIYLRPSQAERERLERINSENSNGEK